MFTPTTEIVFIALTVLTTTTNSNCFIFKDNLKKFTRRLQIKEVFNDTQFEDNSLLYNSLTKSVRTNNSDLHNS